MRFIIDNQLPPALAQHLRKHGHDAVHVIELELDETSDREIWRIASSQPSAIVSKDEDFLNLSLANATGPAFVWVRSGNCRTPTLIATFDARMTDILREISAGQRVIEIR